MACQATQMWSLNGLVAAFLDLVIAYLLLCASAIAFFASKYLAFFGLNLPCPCDGLFFNIPSKDYCLNRLLVDLPAKKVSNIQLCIKKKFPFNDSIWASNHDHHIGGDDCVNGILEIEGDASCSSVSNSRRQLSVVNREFGFWDKKCDVKGKGEMSIRPKSRLHRRRKGVPYHGNCSSVSSYDPSLHEEIFGSIRRSPSSSYKGGNEIAGGNSLLIGYEDEAYDIEYMKPSSIIGMRQSTQNSVQMDNTSNEGMDIKKNVAFIEDLQGEKRLSREDKNTMRLLEQALEEERSTRNALYIELEKERSAAASAADEAMAMILRLQEEKASIEMEARQFLRIIEEKSVYDAEEMNILKEILVRREMEKHFLEKEVEAYSQMVSRGNQELEDDGSDTNNSRKQLLDLLVDPNDDPVLMLRELSASIDKKVMTEHRCDNGTINESPPICYEDEKYCSQKQENVSGCTNDGNLDLQEIGRTSTDLCSLPKGVQEYTFLDKSIPKEENELEKNEGLNGHRPDEKNVITVNGTETSDLCYTENLKQQEIPLVCDVHVVGDGISSCSVESTSKSEHLSVGCSFEARDKISVPFESPVINSVEITDDCPCPNDVRAEIDVKESSSAIFCGLPPMGPKGRHSDLRRSSMSLVDSEMLKIDNEIGQLNERLRIIQEGREKLSFSVANHERENLQLKLLEDIARQVKEIRHLTGSGVAVRQVSLPLPTPKVLSKKKRCRSVSSALQISS